MLVRREPQAVIQPDPREVEEVLWLTEHELLAHPNLLGSVPRFLSGPSRLRNHLGRARGA